MLFPEAEVTKSLSNMIKAYSIRYSQEKRIVDVAERAEAINAIRMAGVQPASGGAETSFVSGLHAVALEEIKEEPDADRISLMEGAGAPEAPEEMLSPEERAAQEQERIEQERQLLRLEIEQEMQAQTDRILGEAKSQAEQIIAEARLAAEAAKQEVFEAAKREGYNAGQADVQQEIARLQEESAAKEAELSAAYEQKTRELEPLAAEVVIQLLDGLTGVFLEERKGIVTYLVSKALSEADHSASFLIKVSKEDFEEVRKSAETLRGVFEREVSLEVIQDVLLKKGECLIETDSGIIDCSLGTQLEGLKEDIRLLSLRERA